MDGLENKRVIVTGSSMGIGRAVALRLAAEGARVVVNARNPDSLQETLALAADKPGEMSACSGSVADYDFAGELVQHCISQFGGIDVLINCAGIAEPYGTAVYDIEIADWRELIDVHLHGTFNTARQATPHMIDQGSGSIINTSSHAFLGIYGGTGYAAGKGAVNSLSYAMATDLREHGINVNVICPGARTRLSSGPEFEQKIQSLSDKGMLSEERKQSALNPAGPEYVASLYAVLASDHAREITGQVYWGSGGYIGRFLPDDQEILASMDHGSAPPWSTAELAAALELP